MPKKSIENNKINDSLASIDIERVNEKREALDRAYDTLEDDRQDQIAKTRKAQKEGVDRLLFVVNMWKRNELIRVVSEIDVDILEKNKLPGTEFPFTTVVDGKEERFNPAEYELQEYISDRIKEDMGEPEFKGIIENCVLLQARNALQAGKARQSFYESIVSEEPDERLRGLKADYLAMHGDTDTIRTDMAIKDVLSSLIETITNHPKGMSKENVDRYSKGLLERFRRGLTVEDKKLFDKGLDIINCKKDAPDEEIADWIEADGKVKVEAMKTEATIDSLKKTEKAILSGEPYKVINEEAVPEYYDNKKYDDTLCLSQVIRKLEATGKGSGMFHKSNSKGYEKMLKTMKAYEKAIRSGMGGLAYELYPDMIKYAKEYIKGKKSVRKSEFGQIRFENVMVFLSKYTDKRYMIETVNRIVTVRGEGFTKSIISDYQDEVEKYEELEKERVKELYEASKMNATKVRPDYRDVIEEFDRQYNAETFYDLEFCITDNGSAFSRMSDEGYASQKDYSTVCYALEIIGNKEVVDHNETKKQVNHLLSDYSMGDKSELADLLTKGIKKLTNNAKEATELNDDVFSLDAEMVSRMVSFLKRDAVLRKFAVKSGLKSEDLRMAEAMVEAGTIMNNSISAEAKLLEAINEEDPDNVIDEEDKLEIITKIVAGKLVNRSMVKADPEAIEAINEDGKDINKKPGLFESLSAKNGADKLYEEIKNVVAESDLLKLKPAEIKNALDDPGCISKLALKPAERPQRSVSRANRKESVSQVFGK